MSTVFFEETCHEIESLSSLGFTSTRIADKDNLLLSLDEVSFVHAKAVYERILIAKQNLPTKMEEGMTISWLEHQRTEFAEMLKSVKEVDQAVKFMLKGGAYVSDVDDVTIGTLALLPKMILEFSACVEHFDLAIYVQKSMADDVEFYSVDQLVNIFA